MGDQGSKRCDLGLEPLIVSEPGEDDDHRGAKQVVVEVVAEKAGAAEQLSQSVHWSPLEVRPGEGTSDGLWTMVLPVARAGAILHITWSIGQFQGVIIPTTPTGS